MKTKVLLSTSAKSISPYQWENIAMENPLRFDSNTLPFPPPSVKSYLNDMNNACPINEYTDPSYRKLTRLLSDYENVPVTSITITNSGDEAIDILAKAFLNPGDYFITTPPTYEMFAIQCAINKGKSLEIPLGKAFEVNETEIIRLSNNPRSKLLFLVNPNNPTGSVISQKTIETMVNKSNCIVVVDEAYREFYGPTSTPLLSKYPNLVILRSFSKFAGLAGARIGYLIASKTLTRSFNAIRFPMGVSYLSYRLAETVLENDRNWMKQQYEMIKRERERLSMELETLGFLVYPSQANFLLVNMGTTAQTICQQLKTKNISVRNRSALPYLNGCVRITVRSSQENDRLIGALKEIT